MENQFWVSVTNAGDSGLLLPIGVILILLLGTLESLRAAFLFTRSLILCLVALVLIKLVFISCGKYWDLGITSPSGHTGLSVMIYGSLATVLMKQVPVEWKVIVAYLAITVVGFIAYSRIVLGAHSWGEVLVGGSIALIALMTFALPYAKLKHPKIKLGLFFGVLATGTMLTYGLHAPAEPVVQTAASYLKIRLNICN
ncbi:MAG TPA: phosphatase PAP2 family protein [Methylophilaceae bacterium]